MDIEQESHVQTLDEIKRYAGNAENNIANEIHSTGQSWFACFRTIAWKNLQTMFNTARLKEEITEEQEKTAQKEIEDMLEKTRTYEKESGSGSTFAEGIPSDSIKQELLERLRKIAEI